MTAPCDPRAVVALDIDGVLRLPKRALTLDRWPGLFHAELTVHRDAYPTAHHHRPPWDEDGAWRSTDRYSGAGVEWVHRLTHDPRVEVWWATTWAEYANTYISPLLGLPLLPVATSSTAAAHTSSAEWKAQQLLDQFPGRALLWVDDNPLTRPRFEDERRPWDRAITRVQEINDSTGITEQDVADMDEWIDQVTSIEGRRQLRHERRSLLSRRRSWYRRHALRR
ncbi:hypothetical protein [Microbacterium aquimaris]|uniref:Secreted protein n=1 Tax=Microbacterium aquimaris TaxID=459816 RepID=A0ABU5N7Z1_9MICO|nr:hypothetical protein [Microbacterium aquimaris]MDZ8162150.1 hypothetical protein [Microbacterium aquimaris]